MTDFTRVSRLLDSMCDAVVLIDDAFCISEASPQLATMLLQQPSRLSEPMRGASIMSIVDEEDRERLGALFACEVAAAEQPDSAHAGQLRERLPRAGLLQLRARGAER